jgi:hypothetical protein
MKALFWSAVINGIVAVPLMVVVIVLASSRSVMGPYTATKPLIAFGRIATAVMGRRCGNDAHTRIDRHAPRPLVHAGHQVVRRGYIRAAINVNTPVKARRMAKSFRSPYWLVEPASISARSASTS